MAAQSRDEEEREPLLSNGNGDSTYGTSSTLTPTGNVSPSPKTADVNDDGEANTEAVQEDPEAQKARRNIQLMLPALAIGVSFDAHNPCTMQPNIGMQIFLAAMDASVVNANYVKIATDFQGLELASWISTA